MTTGLVIAILTPIIFYLLRLIGVVYRRGHRKFWYWQDADGFGKIEKPHFRSKFREAIYWLNMAIYMDRQERYPSK